MKNFIAYKGATYIRSLTEVNIVAADGLLMKVARHEQPMCTLFTEVSFSGSKWKYVTIGSDNGLVLNMWQATTLSNIEQGR